MSNIRKFRKPTVAVLTALLIISIAMPLLSLASAGNAVATLGTTSGPNGTLVQVSGTGFKAGDVVGDITITVDGATGKAIKDTIAGPPAATIDTAYQLKTDANGVLTGYFIIYGLNLGSHTVIISDAESNAVAGTFTITAPTVTVTPSALSAGSSVTVSANGFPSPNSTIVTTFNQKVTAASFSGNPITIDAPVAPATTYTSTSSPTSLSSSKITAGRVTATVSLPAVTAAGPVFTITDQWSNVATTTLSLTTPTVTLSPSSGPVGTWVTATVTGFGPTATITNAGSSIQVGNVVGDTSTATMSPASVTVTEQGTAVFLFQIPAGTTTSLSGVAGAQAVTVTDDKGNVGTATFTVTPKVTMTLGTAATDSTTTYVPATTANVVIRLDATGFKANTAVTFGFSPGIPAAWRTPTATWTDPNTQINANLQLVTDENGQITGIVTDAGTAPTAVGQYWISISDGTTTVTTTINVVTAGDILAVKTLSGAVGQTGVQLTYFGSGTTPTGVTLGGSSATAAGLVAATAWPTPTVATYTVPTVAAGVRTLALVGGAFNTAAFTVLSTSVTTISPSSANVGTTVTVVGSGYATNTVALQIEGATVPAGTVTATMPAGTNLVIITFPVPNYLPSTYTLSVTDNKANTATTSLTVAAPSISITPTSGTLTGLFGTTTLAITGSGFKASDTITVTYDGTTISPAAVPVGLTVINTNGGILICSGFAVVNPSTAGVHTVTVQGSTGAYASATFTVRPQLNALSAVRPGSAVTVSGIGFAASSVLALYINGTQTSWYDTSVTPATVIPVGTTVSSAAVTGSLAAASTRGFVVSSTETSTALNVTIVDAAGNSASTMLSILATPAINVGSTNIVAGTVGTMAVIINGTGFTPRTTPPIAAALYSGSTLVTSVTIVRIDTGATVTAATVSGTGAIPSGALSGLLGFIIPSGITPGTYTLQFTVGNLGNKPVETASTTVTVMGAPTITAPTTAASGSNVTITVTGLTAISTATFKGVNIIGATTFGPVTVLNSGADAYTLTTWFVVPTNEFKGTYLLTLTDANTVLSCQAAITVVPSIALTVATGSKGTTLAVTGSGFAATSALTATVNGQAVVIGAAAANQATDATGALKANTNFVIPVTAVATNTLTITDAAGNTASATFNVTAPVVTITPTTAGAGSTVQIIGSGFTASSPIVIQVGNQVVTTVPAALAANTGGSFITYITIPAGLSGDVTVTATDNSNNVGTATLTTTSSGTGVPSQTTMTSTAQTTTTSGTATTTFTAGSTVKAGFMLQSTSGSRDVVVAVTFQQGAKVYNMASFQTTMTTTPSAVSFSNLIPAGATGTWTATLQVFAADGVTPLAVTTLTFTVA